MHVSIKGTRMFNSKTILMKNKAMYERIKRIYKVTGYMTLTIRLKWFNRKTETMNIKRKLELIKRIL